MGCIRRAANGFTVFGIFFCGINDISVKGTEKKTKKVGWFAVPRNFGNRDSRDRMLFSLRTHFASHHGDIQRTNAA
jgi:hypothetical protein